MMFVKQSIIWRLFFHFVLFCVVVALVGYYFFALNGGDVPFSAFVAVLFVFLIFYLLSVFRLIIKPMRSVMTQMKALLTGRPFKKVYTKRVDEIGVLALFFNKVTESLSRISGTVREGKRMADELGIASQLQKDILPDKPPVVPGLEITVKTRSAVEVGGDNFDFVAYDNGNKTLMYIGDVTGHGVPAALVMTMVHTLVSIFSEMSSNIYDIVVNVNRHLKSRIKSTMFMTMVMLDWDHKNQRMSYVGAGHEHLLVYRANSGECESIMAGGIALGMIPDNSKIVKEKQLDLNVGDVVVLYTDGIIEARNKSGEMFGLKRLKINIQRFAAEYSPEGISYHTASEFSRFVGDALQTDDISLIIVKCVGSGKERVASSMEWGKGEGQKL